MDKQTNQQMNTQTNEQTNKQQINGQTNDWRKYFFQLKTNLSSESNPSNQNMVIFFQGKKSIVETREKKVA